MKIKKCNWCGLVKGVKEFSKRSVAKDGLDYTCKVCRTASRDKEYLRRYGRKNKDILRERKKEYYRKHPDKYAQLKDHRRQYVKENREYINEWTQHYWSNPKNHDRRLKSHAARRKDPRVKQMLSENNKKYMNKADARIKKQQRYNWHYRNNIVFKLNEVFSNQIRQSLKGKKNGHHWESLLPYTLSDLRSHIESKFKEGMSWSNHGVHGWHIDHIIPKSSFNITDFNCEDFKKCWALNNIQPLWWWENLQKGNRLLKPLK